MRPTRCDDPLGAHRWEQVAAKRFHIEAREWEWDISGRRPLGMSKRTPVVPHDAGWSVGRLVDSFVGTTLRNRRLAE